MKSTSRERRARYQPVRLPLAVAIALACLPAAHAQQQSGQTGQDQATQPSTTDTKKDNQSPSLGEVVVTAQKRRENMQKVPISIQVLGQQKLEELHVNKFEDYAKLLPSVSFQNDGPGFNKPYMRGVVSGGPDARMVGSGGDPGDPVDTPCRCRSRRSTTANRRSPRSRTVVTPAARWAASARLTTASICWSE